MQRLTLIVTCLTRSTLLFRALADVHACRDESLPAGAAFWIGLRSQPLGLYLVAGSAEDADGWIDGIRVLSSQAREGLPDALEALLEQQQ